MSSTHISGLPSIDALEALLAAVRRGSLSAAAEELGVTHGAISRRIQGLERWLGVPVFERHGRGVELTPVGAQFARRVERSMGAIVDLATDIRMAHSAGAVRLSLLPSMARLRVMPRMAALQGTPADLSLLISTEHKVSVVDGREADVAIRFGFGDWPSVDAFKLFEETLIPIASPDVADQVGEEPGAILRQPILHDSDTVNWRRWFRGAGIDYRPTAGERRFDDYDLVLAAAKAGIGVALARMPLARGTIEAGGLVRLPGPPMAIKRAHWLVMRQGEQRGAVLRFAERLRTLAAVEVIP